MRSETDLMRECNRFHGGDIDRFMNYLLKKANYYLDREYYLSSKMFLDDLERMKMIKIRREKYG